MGGASAFRIIKNMLKTKIFLVVVSLFLVTGCGGTEPVIDVDSNQESVEGVVLLEEEEIVPPESVEVPILIYHQIREIEYGDSENAQQFIVEPNNFVLQMQYLKDNEFNTVTVDHLRRYLVGEVSEWPEKPVVITFDDGMRNQYENAFPALKENGFRATFFIFTNPIGKNERYLTWEQVEEMIGSGMEIGGHGHYHLYFDRITEDELEKEVVESRELVKEKIDYEMRSLAYPFGVADEVVEEKIKQAGYLLGRGIVNGKVHTVEDLYGLNGYFVTNNFERFKNIVD